MTSAPVGHPLPAPSAPSARSRRPAAEPDTQRSTHPAPVPRELPTRSRITRWPRHRRHQSPRRTQPARSHFLPRGTFAGSFRPGSRSPDTPRNRRSTPRLSTPSPPSTHWYAGDSGVRASPDASSTVSRACSPARGGPAGADQGGVPANFHRRRGAAVSRNRVCSVWSRRIWRPTPTAWIPPARRARSPRPHASRRRCRRG